MQSFTTLVILLITITFSHANVIKVLVGDGGLTFKPDIVTAAPGSKILFMFYGNHSVVQSSFDRPCHPIGNAFYSGFVSSSTPAAPAKKNFLLTINTTDPLWFYCSRREHCQEGQVGVINPPKSGPRNLQAYANAAKSQKENISPDGGVTGGILASVVVIAHSSTSVVAITSTITKTLYLTSVSEGILLDASTVVVTSSMDLDLSSRPSSQSASTSASSAIKTTTTSSGASGRASSLTLYRAMGGLLGAAAVLAFLVG